MSVLCFSDVFVRPSDVPGQETVAPALMMRKLRFSEEK